MERVSGADWLRGHSLPHDHLRDDILSRPSSVVSMGECRQRSGQLSPMSMCAARCLHHHTNCHFPYFFFTPPVPVCLSLSLSLSGSLMHTHAHKHFVHGEKTIVQTREITVKKQCADTVSPQLRCKANNIYLCYLNKIKMLFSAIKNLYSVLNSYSILENIKSLN